MLFRSYCTAALAAMAAISPLAVVTAQSSPSVRGATASVQNHRALAGATGKYLVQLTEYTEDAFQLADDPVGNVDRRLRELQGNSGNRGRGPPSGAGGPKKNAAFELPNGEILEIEGLTAEDESLLASGDEVVLPSEATMSGQKINVHGKPIGRPPNAGNRPDRRLATLTGDKTVVGVRVVTSCNDSTTSSAADLQQYIFDDAVNLAKQYKACSHDQLNIIKPADRSSSNAAVASNIVNGIVTVNINRCVTGADDSVMRNEITDAINTAFGVSSPTQIADHFMYCLPNNTFGGIAYAYMNSWMSVYKDSWCNYVSAQLHEVGHNLNFGHASEGSQEYGDQSGMMGFSYSQNDTPVMCFNAAKSWQSGWFADKSLTINPNNDAGTCFSGLLYGLDSYTSSPADAKVLIQLQSTSGENYHIGFNGKQGSNSGTVEHGNRVLITTQATTGASMKIANLGDGQSYTITNYDGSGRDVVISVTSISGSDHAAIDIQCGPALCSSNDQCDDFNSCTTNVCDGACNFLPIAGCCGNGICEPGSGEDFGLCFDDCAEGPYDLSATLCSSCYIQDGNMFEVKAKDKALAITSLATRTYAVSGAAGTFGVEVWTKQGTMVGFESNMAAWTKIADVSFDSTPWAMLQVPDFDTPVQIAAGATQSFYVTHKNGGKALWTGGSPTRNTLADEDDSLQLFHGYYNAYSFGGRGAGTWNGVLTYMKDNGVVATLAPTTPPPVNPPTPPPSMPPTPPPTNAPVNPPTPPPSMPPTPPPTNAPVNPPTPPPTNAPVNPPTSPPSNPPTPPPTNAPVDPPTPPPTPAPVNPTSPPTPPPTSPSVDKYVCSKRSPLESNICVEGSLPSGECTTPGANNSCGKGGKTCWWASCSGGGGDPPAPTPTPPPTNPPPSPPTGGCPVCAATGEPCCGNCVSGGKPSRRGCF